MPDEIDLSSERAELAREAAATLRRPTGPQPNGMCHWCSEDVPDALRFCGPECRDLWDKYRARL